MKNRGILLATGTLLFFSAVSLFAARGHGSYGISRVEVYPDPAFDRDDLNCLVMDGGDGLAFRWRRNAMPSGIEIARVDAQYTYPGDTWECSASKFYGSGAGWMVIGADEVMINP